MAKRSMSRVILFVGDTARMTVFYRDVIGLDIIDDEDPNFVILNGGGCQLCLHQIPTEYLGKETTEPREDSYVKFVFYSDNVEADRAELIAKGVRMKEIVRWENIALCDGCDPEGNIFQISTRT
jgi:catechol 2,3-dioxygenase-like lactoylglutathione lyase family enzyme